MADLGSEISEIILDRYTDFTDLLSREGNLDEQPDGSKIWKMDITEENCSIELKKQFHSWYQTYELTFTFPEYVPGSTIQYYHNVAADPLSGQMISQYGHRQIKTKKSGTYLTREKTEDWLANFRHHVLPYLRSAYFPDDEDN